MERVGYMDLLMNPFIIFIFGFLFLRFTGKKAVSQMHTFDVLYVIVIGNAISQPIQKNNIWLALLCTGIFVLLL